MGWASLCRRDITRWACIGASKQPPIPRQNSRSGICLVGWHGRAGLWLRHVMWGLRPWAGLGYGHGTAQKPHGQSWVNSSLCCDDSCVCELYVSMVGDTSFQVAMAEVEDMDVVAPAEEGDEAESPGDEKGPEFEPPQASIAKLVKRALGDSVQVGKEAKSTLTRAAGIFILYLTACANDFCREGRRTTINANDVLQALKELDFDDFVEPLKVFLQQHNSAKKMAKETKTSSKAKSANDSEEGQQAEEDAAAEEDAPAQQGQNEDDEDEEEEDGGAAAEGSSAQEGDE